MAQVVLRYPACHNTARSNNPSTRITWRNCRTDSQANKPPRNHRPYRQDGALGPDSGLRSADFALFLALWATYLPRPCRRLYQSDEVSRDYCLRRCSRPLYFRIPDRILPEGFDVASDGPRRSRRSLYQRNPTGSPGPLPRLQTPRSYESNHTRL